ncbi:histidine phosphatase family protein [Aliidiomarina halalkaliphila]|uniref:Histidine phosphatase family protein n=1 Tax=Aliidiomarina halalkaliphila TaxID=2593535 RepID=A0A552X3D8_9GAMM|nr:histidine phosphatase family protein [Aliidiomarina halalkaliphila]TRW49532.1 histidine phosphatase family protein [Aliidiomarina halalkaliphila]
MALVTLVRHGQASFGSADYDNLSELGYQQLQHLGAQLANQGESFDMLVRGTLKRHQQSLDALVDGYGDVLREVNVISDPAWNEFDHRAVMLSLGQAQPELQKFFADDGTPQISPDDVMAIFMQSVRRWQSGAHDHEYPESWPQFVARVEHAWQRLRDWLSHKRILVLTSGGPISLSAAGAMGLPTPNMMTINAQLVNGGLSRFMCKPKGNGDVERKLISLNEHIHVSGRYQHLLTYR